MVSNSPMRNFPKGFTFGAATAAYQIEGAYHEDGKGLSIWDTFSHISGKVDNNDNGDIACDHYHRYKEDIALLKELGIKNYRMSIAWTRLFPTGRVDSRNQKGFDYYNDLIDTLLEAGIEPFVTLYHWDLPQALEDLGGWKNREILTWFGEYAAEVAKAFGDRVTYFSPINEPWVVAWLGHGMGIHAPGDKDRAKAFAAAHHTVVAHGVANRAMKAVYPHLKIGPVLNQTNFPIDDSTNAELKRAQDILDANQNRFWIDAIFHKRYPEILIENFPEDILPNIHEGDFDLAATPNDWLGINYYFDTPMKASSRPVATAFDPAALLGLNVDQTPPPPLTDMGWPISPDGLSNLLIRWHKEIGNRLPPIYITENGVAYDDGPGEDGLIHDQRRIDYLRGHLAALLDACEVGVDVRGYFQWSLLDNFEWALGYSKRFGIVHVDYQTLKRTPKDSALWYSGVIARNALD